MKILIADIVVLFVTDICHCRKCEGGNNTSCCSGHFWNAELKSCTQRNGLYTVDILRKIILGNNDKRTKKKTDVNQSTSAATDVGFDKKDCEDRRHHGKSVSTIKTTIVCLFVLAGILVLLYTGARFMVTK